MTTHKLIMDNRFIDPRWLSRVMGKSFDIEVDPDGKLDIEGEMHRFQYTPLPPGTKVRARLDGFGYMYCATLAEIEEREKLYKANQEAEKQAYRDKLNRFRDEAKAFNETIKLPVKWDVGQKDVLSGLSEKWGDGRNKATVNHIYLQEDLNIGRLKRSKDDFLCSSNDKMNGKRWSTTVITGTVDGDGKEYQPKVTCKTCLAILERIKCIPPTSQKTKRR